MKYLNHFDDLILFDGASFDPPVIDENTLKIFAHNVVLTPEHPYNTCGTEIALENVVLIFNDVTKSVRVISEYAGDPKQDGFLPPYSIVDVLSIVNASKSKSFVFDGILTHPLSHVDWNIEASSFVMEIP